MPIADYPSSDWAKITNKNELIPGDVLATHQGHKWGARWHGGLYYGKQNGEYYVLDASLRDGLNGADVRKWHSDFQYYYIPIHEKLKNQQKHE